MQVTIVLYDVDAPRQFGAKHHLFHQVLDLQMVFFMKLGLHAHDNMLIDAP